MDTSGAKPDWKRFAPLKASWLSTMFAAAETHPGYADEEEEADLVTSVRYLASSAYKECYGEMPVWKHYKDCPGEKPVRKYYRRNFKGQIPPRTRKTCIGQSETSNGGPCPVCRDEYLVLDHQNVALLKQFVSPQTGEVLDPSQTGLCQYQQLKLLTEVAKVQRSSLCDQPGSRHLRQF